MEKEGDYNSQERHKSITEKGDESADTAEKIEEQSNRSIDAFIGKPTKPGLLLYALLDASCLP